MHYFNRGDAVLAAPGRAGRRRTIRTRPGCTISASGSTTSADVDAAARELRALGVAATEPALYPEYAPDYYATFFSDPDGLRLEIVALRGGRASWSGSAGPS